MGGEITFDEAAAYVDRFKYMVTDRVEGFTVFSSDYRDEPVSPAVIEFYERRFRAKHGKKTARSLKKGMAALEADLFVIHQREWEAGL